MINRTKLIWAIGIGAVALVTVAVSVWLFRQNGIAFLNLWQNEAIIKSSASPPVLPSASPVGEVKLLFLGDLMFDRNIRQAAQKTAIILYLLLWRNGWPTRIWWW